MGSKKLNGKEIGFHVIVAFILISFGNISTNSLIPHFLGIFPYLLAFLSFLLVFQFPLELDQEKGVWYQSEWSNTKLYFSLSLFLIILSVVIGIYLDDPIM